MIKGKYVATVEVDFSMTEDTPNLLPFDKLQDAVRNGITPNLQIFLEEEVSGLGTVTVQQQYADLYIKQDGGANDGKAD
jgi:hypothetical protein